MSETERSEISVPEASSQSGPTIAERLGHIEREADFEHERVMAMARRGLFGERSAPPPVVGRYRIDRRIGAGGMGEVYLGFDAELERELAIKLVRAEFCLGGGGERLRVEAKALARLSHPNVVQVYEVGEHEGRTFLAMEYVPGQTLGEWLHEEQRCWREVLPRFLAAGRGLAAAHAAGVVHRDFKPANVLLTPQGRVCVADFGLALTGLPGSGDEATREHDLRVPATDAEPSRAPAHRLSMTGAVMGTVRFMPLEQLEAGVVDPRADQFAFCVALYEALWRESPFPADGVAERCAALRADRVRLPPRGPAPMGLWRAIRRGLARHPDQRWPDMDALLDALEAVPRRRTRLAFATVATPAFAGLVALAWPAAPTPAPDPCANLAEEIDSVWSSAHHRELEEQFVSTELAFAEASAAAVSAGLDAWRSRWLAEREQLCRATVSAALADEVSGLRGACLERQRAGFDATVAVLLQADAEAVTRAQELLAQLPALEPCRDDEALILGMPPPSPQQRDEVEDLRSELARLRAETEAGHSGELEPRAEELVRRAEASAYVPVLAEALGERGHLEFARLELDAAVESTRAAIDLAEASRHDELLAELWLSLALHGLTDMRDAARGESWLRRARSSKRRTGLDPRTTSRLEFADAKLAELTGDRDRAEQHLRAAIAGLDQPELADDLRAQLLRPAYLGHLAGLLTASKGREDEIISLRAAALDAAERSFPPGHPEIAAHAFNLGQARLAAGREAEARPLLERAARLWLDSHRAPDPQLGAALLSLAQLELGAGELDAARDHATQAEAVFARSLPPGAHQHGNAAMTLAVIAHMSGALEAALEAYTRAAALFAAVPGVDIELDPNIALIRANAGACALELGRLELAREHFEAAAALDRPGPHAIVASLGLAQLALGEADLAGAREHLRALTELEGLDAGDELELEFLRASLALRESGRAPSLSPNLRAALDDPAHEHHRRLAVATRTLNLSDAERQTLTREIRDD
jgi:tetratricopeptide (TPR) repeat protein/predicted Ser/Thr protein kinase